MCIHILCPFKNWVVFFLLRCLSSLKDEQVSTIFKQRSPWPSLDPCYSHCFSQNFLKEFSILMVSTHSLFKLLQSGSWTQPFTESALTKVTRGCFVTKFNGHFSSLCLITLWYLTPSPSPWLFKIEILGWNDGTCFCMFSYIFSCCSVFSIFLFSTFTQSHWVIVFIAMGSVPT